VLAAGPQELDAAAREKGPLLLSPVAKVVRVWLAGRLLSETFLLKCLYAGSRKDRVLFIGKSRLLKPRSIGLASYKVLRNTLRGKNKRVKNNEQSCIPTPRTTHAP
jgi:hypothetical protein